MQQYNETMPKSQYDENYKTGQKDWGDQVDIVLKSNEIKQEDDTLYEIEYLRCTKKEFESMSIEELKEVAQTQNYTIPKFIQQKIENQSKAIDLLIEVLEEEDEQ